MDTIRIQYRDTFDELETFDTMRQAMMCEPVSNVYNRGYAVLFTINERFAVYIAYEDRYYYQFLPKGSQCLLGGLWEKYKTIDWKPIENMSEAERKLLGDKFSFLYE